MASEWPTVKLGELADSVSDTHSLGKEKLIFLNTSDVLLGKILHQDYSAVSEWPGQAKKSIRRDDILFSEIRPANGRWAFVDRDAADYVVSTKLMVIRPRQNKIVPRFLYHFLTSEQTTRWLQHLAESRSGTFPQITFDQVAELELALPPNQQQAAIAQFLDQLSDKIELNHLMNETLESIALALFKSWFVNFDPVRAKAEGRDPRLPKHIADLFPNSFEESQMGEIPKNWEVRSLGDVTSYLNRGISPTYIDEGGVLVLNQKCVRDGRVDTTRGRRHDTSRRSIDGRTLVLGDMLVNSTGVGTLGRVAQVLYLDEPTIVDSHVTVARADGVSASWNFLGMVLRDREREIEALGEGSTGQTELSRSRLAALPFVLPNPRVMSEFDRLCVPLRAKTSINERSNCTLATVRDALLPKLISGELRIPDVERIVGGQL
jgi:type I restriction enzyme, S subunit